MSADDNTSQHPPRCALLHMDRSPRLPFSSSSESKDTRMLLPASLNNPRPGSEARAPGTITGSLARSLIGGEAADDAMLHGEHAAPNWSCVRCLGGSPACSQLHTAADCVLHRPSLARHLAGLLLRLGRLTAKGALPAPSACCATCRTHDPVFQDALLCYCIT